VQHAARNPCYTLANTHSGLNASPELIVNRP
jgi:hypothetical protein